MKISINEEGTAVSIEENLLRYYCEITHSLLDYCPIQYVNSTLVAVDEDETLFHVNECSHIYTVNGIGEYEKTIYKGKEFVI